MTDTTEPTMKSPKQLRILCLGASLVAGFSAGGAVYHPFSHNLVKKLRTAMPETDIEIVVDGVPGDRVTTGKFIDRMRDQCKLRIAQSVVSNAYLDILSLVAVGKQRFDWSIVLGATK